MLPQGCPHRRGFVLDILQKNSMSWLFRMKFDFFVVVGQGFTWDLVRALPFIETSLPSQTPLPCRQPLIKKKIEGL